jgi:hypothetical protein
MAVGFESEGIHLHRLRERLRAMSRYFCFRENLSPPLFATVVMQAPSFCGAHAQRQQSSLAVWHTGFSTTEKDLGQAHPKSSCYSCEYWPPLVRLPLPAQTVDATLAWSLLAGVWNPKVFLGR